MQVYIVYLGLTQHNDPYLTSNSHIQLLSSVFSRFSLVFTYFTYILELQHLFILLIILFSEEDAKRSMLYSYKHAFSGFSARLSSTQAASLASNEPKP